MKWTVMLVSGLAVSLIASKFLGVSNPLAIMIIGFSVPFVAHNIYQAFFE